MIGKRRKLSSKLSYLLAISPLSRSSAAFCFLGSISSAPHMVIHADCRAVGTQNSLLSWDPRGGRNFLMSFKSKEQWFPRSKHVSTCRGGWQKGAATSATNEEAAYLKPEERWRRRGMSVALAATYLTVMGAKCALPSVLPLLISPQTGLSFPKVLRGATSTSPQGYMARLLGLSTLAVAMGKLLLGPIIDTTGGIRALQVALTSLALLLVTLSFTQQFTFFAFSWILVDFIFSSCWAGCINAIHQSFPEQEWGRQVGLLAAGARTGNAFAFSLFAAILFALEGRIYQSWRIVFGVSAILQILPILLLTYFGGMTLTKSAPTPVKQEDKASLRSSLLVVRREARTPEFWLHLLSRSSLMVFGSFLLFVPMLMSQVYGSSNAFAAQTGSIYALGCLLSVSLGSSFYAKLPKKKQAVASCLLLGISTLSSLTQLAHVAGILNLSVKIAAFTMFLWGFGFAVPFYIPPSLYALARGGKVSSATIADVFDIGGFSLLALFNGYVASIQHATVSAWIPTFQITTACSLVSLISLTLAVLRQ